MDFQGIAIQKGDDKTMVLVLNIEKLAETIVVKGNGLEDEKIKESLVLLIKETLNNVIQDFSNRPEECLKTPTYISINTLISAIAAI